MPQPTLEERVATLEAAMERLLAQSASAPATQGWRSTLGMFAGDSMMQEIDEEGRKIRKADREQTRS